MPSSHRTSCTSHRPQRGIQDVHHPQQYSNTKACTICKQKMLSKLLGGGCYLRKERNETIPPKMSVAEYCLDSIPDKMNARARTEHSALATRPFTHFPFDLSVASKIFCCKLCSCFASLASCPRKDTSRFRKTQVQQKHSVFCDGCQVRLPPSDRVTAICGRVLR